ncbi:hypothetical protein PR048_023105 [Dryococelus australis]|uniref:Uncharacterized protein n=1 Tax=Dryococelus australis TaxID=614101 RepID=A0ABQ9GT50_9NEOP|nr:hypothetical protein PR048_023105 [Dryococelus australis]
MEEVPRGPHYSPVNDGVLPNTLESNSEQQVVASEEDLLAMLMAACDQVRDTPSIFQRVLQSLIQRMNYGIDIGKAHFEPLMWWPDYSPPTKGSISGGVASGFSYVESYRMIPLVGRFSRGSSVSPANAFSLRFTLIGAFHTLLHEHWQGPPALHKHNRKPEIRADMKQLIDLLLGIEDVGEIVSTFRVLVGWCYIDCHGHAREVSLQGLACRSQSAGVSRQESVDRSIGVSRQEKIWASTKPLSLTNPDPVTFLGRDGCCHDGGCSSCEPLVLWESHSYAAVKGAVHDRFLAGEATRIIPVRRGVRRQSVTHGIRRETELRVDIVPIICFPRTNTLWRTKMKTRVEGVSD